jgi:hypothetical protein
VSGPDLERDEDGLVRLHKLLARSGVASRRRCEELMLAGEVIVDDEVVTRLGTKVDPTTAVIRVSGRRLPPISSSRSSSSSRSGRYGASSGSSSREVTPMRSRKYDVVR